MYGDKEPIEWTRFWLPADEELDLHSGFLSDPEEWDFVRDKLSLLPEIVEDKSGLVVLLGSGGMGKTWELRRFCKGSEDRRLYEAPKYQSQNYLSFREWLQNEIEVMEGIPTTLVFDGFGEVGLDFSKFRRALQHSVPEFEERTILVSCRDTDWSGTERVDSRRTSNSDDLRTFRLAPLRQQDVERAADENDVNPTAFLSEGKSRDLHPFLRKPQTLVFLLKEFKSRGQLQETRFDIYETACRHLAVQPDYRRKSDELQSNLDEEERLEVAGRIAIVLQVSNRDFIADERPSDIQKDPHLVSVDEVTEANNFNPNSGISRRDVLETLRSALFNQIETESGLRYKFDHRNYEIFLFVRYIRESLTKNPSRFPRSKRRRLEVLFGHREESEHMTGHLRAAAPWLMTEDDEFFDFVCDRCPGVTGEETDFEKLSDDQSKRVVETLMNEAKAWRFAPSPFVDYSALEYPDIEETVRRPLTDESYCEPARRFAIELIEDIQLVGCRDKLVEIALDEQLSPPLREQAISAIEELPPLEDVTGLKELALNSRPNAEVPWRVQRRAADILYPDRLSTNELLEKMEVWENKGGWRQFPVPGFVQRFDDDELADVLDWLQEEMAELENPAKTRPVVGAISQRAWSALDEKDVRSSLAGVLTEAAECRLTGVDWIQDQNLNEGNKLTAEKRRAVITRAVEKCLEQDIPTSNLLDILLREENSSLFSSEDVDWVAEKISDSKSERREKLWVNALIRLVSIAFEKVKSVIEELDLTENQAERLRDRLKTARNFRQNTEQTNDEENTRQSRAEEIRSHLQSDTPTWCDIFRIARPEEAHSLTRDMGEAWETILYVEEANQELSITPSKLALDYLEEQPTNDITPYENELLQWWATVLVAGSESTSVKQLSVEGARRAIRSIWDGGPFHSIDRDDIEHLDAYALEFETTFRKELESHVVERISDNENPGQLANQYVHEFAGDIEPVVREFLEDGQISGAQFKAFEYVDEYFDEVGTNWLEAKLKDNISGTTISSMTDELEELVRLSLEYAPNKTWSHIETLLPNFSDSVESVLRGVCRAHAREWAKALSVDVAKSVYKFVVKYTEPEDKRSNDNFYDDTFGLLRHIRTRLGDVESVAAVSNVDELISFEEEHGSDSRASSLRWTRIDAVRNARAPTEDESLAPGEVLEIVDNRSARIVDSGEELRNLVVESLYDLELRWHSVNWQYQVVEMWNESKDKDTDPKSKDEEAYSDHLYREISRNLSEFNLLLSRENELEPRESGMGVRIDLEVEAPTPNSGDSSSNVEVEVKKCKNSSAVTAMEDQLVDQYLDKTTPFGLYVVICNCPSALDEPKNDLEFRGARKNCDEVGGDLWEKVAERADKFDGDPLDVDFVVLDAQHPEIEP